MPISHRNGDSRACGASTEVSGQDFITVDGQLWSVNGDGESHGGGALSSSHPWLTIDGKGVIVVGDGAAADDLCPILDGPHCSPNASSGDDTVSVDD